MKRIEMIPYELSQTDVRASLRHVRNIYMHVMDIRDRKAWAGSTSGLLTSLRVFSAGIFTQAWQHRRSRKGLNEGILIYCTAGQGYYRQGRRQWPVKPGDLLYCPPLTQHEYWADERNPWTICWAHLSGPRLAGYEQLMGLVKNGPIRHIGIRTDLEDAFRRMIQLYAPPHDTRHLLAIQSAAIGILGLIASTPETMETRPTQTQFVQKIKQMMESRLNQPFNLSTLAKEAGYHPGHLIRLFRQVEGIPPAAYFNRRKMQHACSLLSDPSLQIRHIAECVGFNDPLYFSRAFKKIIGIPPLTYRRQSLDEH